MVNMPSWTTVLHTDVVVVVVSVGVLPQNRHVSTVLVAPSVTLTVLSTLTVATWIVSLTEMSQLVKVLAEEMVTVTLLMRVLVTVVVCVTCVNWDKVTVVLKVPVDVDTTTIVD